MSRRRKPLPPATGTLETPNTGDGGRPCDDRSGFARRLLRSARRGVLDAADRSFTSRRRLGCGLDRTSGGRRCAERRRRGRFRAAAAGTGSDPGGRRSQFSVRGAEFAEPRTQHRPNRALDFTGLTEAQDEAPEHPDFDLSAITADPSATLPPPSPVVVAAPAVPKSTSNPFASLSAAKAEAAARPTAPAITDDVIEDIVSRVLRRMSDHVVRETVTADRVGDRRTARSGRNQQDQRNWVSG